MSELTEKALLDILASWRRITYCWEGIDEQAYTQIRTIIEQHFSDPVQVDEDVILKIVEICEEPELAVWKIAKVKELFARQSEVDDHTVMALAAVGLSDMTDHAKERIKHLLTQQGKPQKRVVTEKQARECYAHIAVGQLKIDGFLIWLEQHSIEVVE